MKINHVPVMLFSLLSLSSYGSLFLDDYTLDTSDNYQQHWNNGTFTHNTVDGTLDYSRSGGGYVADAYLVKSTVFNLDTLSQFTVEGQITYDTTTLAQAGLAIAASNNSGGFFVFRHTATNEWRVGLLPDNLGDAVNGSTTLIGAHEGIGTYDITMTLDRSGDDAILDIEIVGPTNTLTLNNHVFEDSAGYGGNQVGWWVRNGNDVAAQSFGSISVIPEPGTLALVGIALGAMLLGRRRWRR